MRAIALLIAMLFALPAAAQKCDKGTAKKPLVEGPVYTLSGADGPVAPHRKASILIRCDSLIRLHGLVDGNNKILVPAIYNQVIPITPNMAAVQHMTFGGPPSRQISEPFYYYVYGKGQQNTPLPYRGFGEFVSGTTRYPYAYNSSLPNNFEYSIFANGSSTPVLLRNLGGSGWPLLNAALDRHADVLFANFTAADGAPLTRVLNLKGEPISPVIGGVEKWETKPVVDFDRYQRNPYEKPLSTEYISLAYSEEHPDLPYGQIYVPVGSTGSPLPLPANAIGVFPLKVDSAGLTKHTFGWALVYAHHTGFRIRWALGSLDSVIARAATLPEVAGMRRLIDGRINANANAHIDDVFAIRSAADGLWRMVYAHDLKTGGMGSADPGTATSARALYNRYITQRMDFQRGIALKQAEDRARGEATLHAWQDTKYRALVASGQLCANPYAVMELHNEAIAHVLRECPNVTPTLLEFAAARRVDPATISGARRGYDRRVSVAQMTAAAEERRAREWEAANAPINWNAWSDEALKDVRDSTDNWIADQRRKYYDNLRAWNTGKNKTCC